MTAALLLSLAFWGGVALCIAKVTGTPFLDDVSWWLTSAPIWGSVITLATWITAVIWVFSRFPAEYLEDLNERCGW